MNLVKVTTLLWSVKCLDLWITGASKKVWWSKWLMQSRFKIFKQKFKNI